MVPMGYMAKRIIAKPDWLKNANVKRLFSVSGCNSHNLICAEQDESLLNGHWMLNRRAEADRALVVEADDDAQPQTFYYELYPEQWNDCLGEWEAFSVDSKRAVTIEVPQSPTLEGFDIVSFAFGSQPECSLLSCSHLAERVCVNEQCLLPTLEEAKTLLASGEFHGCEPGPYRILAVYSLN
ncbi:hypothetical protein F0521_18020 [Ferrimonas sp. YFM]|nr:hypothetical protein F0521_18020 [Ferrimonas sp. YFM]